ncbi:hypothetical protein COY00_03035 [Candidatus Pacearchaeota archaeon CG_4_10_14_0_2_um_filter_35_33]|nr:MAG: hypothetical protein COY79_04730 [Candidatus Pacearchaeota archaeon CG_4_10_14_0_8_um_filter_35_169]PIZ79951.1 MAG: hypothetical protein COY00_03035 [Candidatus Pacearchaeota archaeon CG_4_10_14_0_2_um_filter_35_33]
MQYSAMTAAGLFDELRERYNEVTTSEEEKIIISPRELARKIRNYKKREETMSSLRSIMGCVNGSIKNKV